jgi:hypothetical protein
LIGLALELPQLRWAFAQPPDKQPAICCRVKKSDLSSEPWKRCSRQKWLVKSQQDKADAVVTSPALPSMINLSLSEVTIKKHDGLSLYIFPILKSVAGASVRAGRFSNQKCLVRGSNCIPSRRQNLVLRWRHRVQVCRDHENWRGSTCESTIWRSQIERAAIRSIGRINVICYVVCESCASSVRK